MGEILENTNLVMTIEFFNEDDERITPGGEPLFRGTSMVTYREGRWHRQSKRLGSLPTPPSMLEAPSRIIQRIKLEPQDSTILFGLRPILMASSPGGRSPS